MSEIRLYANHELHSGQTFKLNKNQAHYLSNVMRRRGDVAFFNEKYGEWSATFDRDNVKINSCMRLPEVETIKEIAIACIKKPRLEWAVEKLTELGITDVYLVETRYSQRIQYNFDRFSAISIEAAEQCGRLGLAKIHPPIPLAKMINKKNLILAAPNGSEALNIKGCPIIGPEGGFAPEELDMLSEFPSVSLGRNILRAETAAIVAGSRIV